MSLFASYYFYLLIKRIRIPSSVEKQVKPRKNRPEQAETCPHAHKAEKNQGNQLPEQKYKGKPVPSHVADVFHKHPWNLCE